MDSLEVNAVGVFEPDVKILCTLLRSGIPVDSGDDAARVQLRSIVGHCHDDRTKSYVGYEAQHRRDIAAITHPIQRGIISDWDAMELVWDHVLREELRTVPDQTAVLLASKYTDSRGDQEKMTQIMFEKLGVRAFQNEMQAVLSSYASGRTTTLSIDSGDGATVIVPVYEGFAISHAKSGFPIAGRDMSDYIEDSLIEHGHLGADNHDKILYIKQTNCSLHLSSGGGIGESKNTCRLPDGQVLCLGDDIPRAPEALFKPSILGLTARGIHEAAHEAIQKCDPDLQRMMYQAINPSGGNTGFMGFVPRLAFEMQALVSAVDTGIRVNVLSSGGSVERKHQVFLGGSILTCLSSFQTAWCNRAEYDEFGPGILHRKWKS